MNDVFMQKLNDKVREMYEFMNEQPRELPPRTADYIEGVRALQAVMSSLHRDEKHLHNGWLISSKILKQSCYDNDTHTLLAHELSEQTGVPFFITNCISYQINDDPSQMKWGLAGMLPPIAKEKSTHTLTMIAYGGVKEGWWSLDDVDIPPHHFDELDLEIGGPSVWVLGDDYEMLQGDE